VEAVVREHDADVRERRLGDHGGDVAAGEDALQRCEVVERDDARAGRGARVEAEQLGLRRVLVALDERVVQVAVVVAAEDDQRVAARAVAREPNRLRVGARGGERELPAGEAVALGEQLGGLDRLLDGEQDWSPRAARSEIASSTAGGVKPEVALTSAWLKST